MADTLAGVARRQGEVEGASREAGRLPLSRRARRRPLRRQGEVAAVARAQLLPGGQGRPPRVDPQLVERIADVEVIVTLDRGRGAAPGAEPRQAPPAAVQRPAPRRQVVPVHRGHGRGRVPARDVHARAAPPRRRLLRAVREREEGARDARRAQPRLPVPAVRGAEAGPPLRDPVPRLPHRALPRAVRRRDLEGGLRRDHRRRDRLPLRRHAHDRARAASGGCARPPRTSASRRRRATGTGSSRSRTSRERQAADRREIGSIDVIGLAVDGDRAAVQVFPLRDGKMIDRYGFHLENVEGQDVTTILEAFCLEYYGTRRRSRRRSRPARGDRTRGARGVPHRAARLARRGARARARREAAARRARRRRTRGSRSTPRPLASEQKRAAPRRGARGAARGAQPREPAAADRVLRRLEHPGPGDRRLDGRLRGRAARRRRTTASSRCAGSTARTTSPRWPRSSRAASRGCAPASRPSTTRASRRRRTSSSSTAARGSSRPRSRRCRRYELPRVAVIALAKREEEVFVPGPVRSDRARPAQPGLQLLQRIRDEAHRFALGFHRQRRDARARESIFDTLEGIGPARRRAILQHFGSAEGVLAASQEELEGVPGVPAKTARAIYAQLHRTGPSAKRRLRSASRRRLRFAAPIDVAPVGCGPSVGRRALKPSDRRSRHDAASASSRR